MHSDGIIGVDDLLASAIAVQDAAGANRVVEQLKQIEPCLAGYLDNEITLLAGKMAMSGANPGIVREITQRVMMLLMVVFHAQRAAGVRLWGNAFPDSPLATLINLAGEEPPKEQAS